LATGHCGRQQGTRFSIERSPNKDWPACAAQAP
jgi:hypothetical protein